MPTEIYNASKKLNNSQTIEDISYHQSMSYHWNIIEKCNLKTGAGED